MSGAIECEILVPAELGKALEDITARLSRSILALGCGATNGSSVNV